MPLERLTPSQLKRQPRGRANKEYLDFVNGLKSGEGGRTTTAKEGTTKQTIKNRLNKAAKVAGVRIRFLRTPPTEVVFTIER